jgi:hypothetical protein
MAFYDTADALYGTGTYGSARYGRVTPVVQVTGVSATANTRTIHLNVFEVDVTEPIYNAQGATGSIGGLTLNTTAGLTGVSTTGTINSVGVGVSKLLDAVSTTTSINTVTVNITEKPEGVVATFTLDTAGLNVKSINTIEVVGFGLTGSIGTAEPQTLEALQSVSATVLVNTVAVNLTEKVTGVSATGSIGSLENSNTVTLTGAVGTGQIGNLGGAPTEEIDSVEATVSIGTVKSNITEIIPSSIFPFVQGNTLGATISVKLVPQTAAQLAAANAAPQGEAVNIKIVTDNFDFDAVATQYSRRRTVTVSRAA